MSGAKRQSKKQRPDGLSRIQEMNRAKILEAALGQFSRFGYSGTTIEKIAGEAGMSKSNLLYYFASKPDIYEAVLEHILDVWLAPLRMLDPDRDPATELSAYIRQKLQMSAELPEASRLFANEVMQGAPRIRRVLEEDLKGLVAEKSEVIRHWIAAGKIRETDPVHLIFLIWAMTQHYADFQTQIELLTGQNLKDPDFRKGAEEAVIAMVLSGVGLTPGPA
ncbi:TetR family transcriptional regulator C-terminal domain-containing protein [Roseibium litorale]|uniref:TetR family transcriptional regulator C-terminal domain-containing protein n=1 Tax=Roseibium litorale TaxID=2803841 RepID=A0ABR9CJ00_9HYPH|nr:TetR family transcriptional regulator C-terminal domain-containing protein [Roseibium litorale]MBD8890810.1 TetR family transcriptional regulator C-terminal domain-containing protein [Roseibium litorale]